MIVIISCCGGPFYNLLWQDEKKKLCIIPWRGRIFPMSGMSSSPSRYIWMPPGSPLSTLWHQWHSPLVMPQTQHPSHRTTTQYTDNCEEELPARRKVEKRSISSMYIELRVLISCFGNHAVKGNKLHCMFHKMKPCDNLLRALFFSKM